METSKKALIIIIGIIIILGLAIFVYNYRSVFNLDFNLKEKLKDLKFLTFSPISVPESNLGNQQILENNNNQLQKYYGNLPDGFAEEDISEYYGKFYVSASPVSSNISFLNNPSRIGISVNLGKDEKIDITGWRIQSNSGTIFIPKASEIFQPVYGGTPSDIILKNSNRLEIYSSVSPIGINFRLNKCIGYIAKSYNFIPPFYSGCPSISRSEYSYLPGECQNIINSYNGNCGNPADQSNYNYLSDDCKSVLRRFNYTSCFQDHSKDVDFLSSEWKIWTGLNILDSYHDRILFFDNKGKLVNEYIY